MTIRIHKCKQYEAWDGFAFKDRRSTVYHLAAWKSVFERSYGLEAHYLVAVNGTKEGESGDELPSGVEERWGGKNKNFGNSIVGLLPLVVVRDFFSGKSLFSLPFLDYGGILALDEKVERALLCEAIKLAKHLRVKSIELRHTEPLGGFSEFDSDGSDGDSTIGVKAPLLDWVMETRVHKVRMLLELPASSEALFKSFKAKLRSQIRRPLKEGLYSRVGGQELLDDFYKVFSANMKDLGSPVHSKKLMKYVLDGFSQQARIVVVYKDVQPLACSLIIGYKDTLSNPWASALREFSRLSPNMLLYWSMLEYGSDNGYSYFDFGRSTPGEGTYRFKKQWGAEAVPLYWHYVSQDGKLRREASSGKNKFEKGAYYWKKLPVSMTKFIGPMIRKRIGL